MKKYVALLRGINVSGRRIIKMAELKSLFVKLGYSDATTYIQSGNVIFTVQPGGVVAENLGALRNQLESAIESAYGFPVTVVLREQAELANAIENSPYDVANLQGGEFVYIAFLSDTPTEDAVRALLDYHDATDDFRLQGNEVYILYRQSAHKSKLQNSFLERKLKVPSTIRNWQTVNRLTEI